MLNLQPAFQDWIIPCLTILLAGFGLWLMTRVNSWLTAHAKFIDAAQRAQIASLENQAWTAATNFILNWVATTGEKVQPKMDNWLLRQGAQVAIDHAGGILRDNGMDPETVAATLLAKLPANVITTDTTGATSTINHIQTENLSSATKGAYPP